VPPKPDLRHKTEVSVHGILFIYTHDIYRQHTPLKANSKRLISLVSVFKLEVRSVYLSACLLPVLIGGGCEN
jgi:hypothetical protein